MVERRVFRRVAGHWEDEYTQQEGNVISVIMPDRVMDHLTWGPSRKRRTPTIEPLEDLQSRRAHAHERLRVVALSELTTADVAEAAKLAVRETGALLTHRFDDLVEAEKAGRLDVPDVLFSTAKALLLVDPTNVAAAELLARRLFEPETSARSRVFIASAVAESYRRALETEAMECLRQVLLRLLAPNEPLGWARFAYCCVSPLLEIAPEETIERCRSDLEQRGEGERDALIAHLSRACATIAVALLRHHLKSETSPRLRLRLVVALGSLVAPSIRRAVLQTALESESPWWRWQAIQELWRVRPEVIRSLALPSAAVEPDHCLRRLLLEADQVGMEPATKALRSRYY